MQGRSDRVIFRLRFEVEVAGTEEEVRGALARNVRERRDPLIGPEDSNPQWKSSPPEEALYWIADGLQIEEQIRRAMNPLTVNQAEGGLSVSRILPSAPHWPTG